MGRTRFCIFRIKNSVLFRLELYIEMFLKYCIICIKFEPKTVSVVLFSHNEQNRALTMERNVQLFSEDSHARVYDVPIQIDAGQESASLPCDSVFRSAM